MAEIIESQKAILDKIDDAVCISLQRRPERWESFSRRAKLVGLGFVRRFNAIDGRDLDLPEELKTHKGAYGCLYSHAAVFREALAKGFTNIMVFEDDSVFPLGAVPIVDYLRATINEYSWIHFGGYHSAPIPIANFHTHIQVSYILNTHAYVINRDLMRHYVEYVNKNPHPDNNLMHTDRLLAFLCQTSSFKICMPPVLLSYQDKSLPKDVEWGRPKKYLLTSQQLKA